MSAIRKNIRHKMVEILKKTVEAVEGRVFANRKVPFRHAQLPAVVVYTTGEEGAEDYDSTRLRRRARMTVELVVDATSGAVDDQCDEIAEAIEQTLFACPYLEGEAGHMTLTDVDGPEILVEGELMAASLRINWLAEYLQPIPSDDITPEQPLREIAATWNTEDASNDTPEAVDVIPTAEDE